MLKDGAVLQGGPDPGRGVFSWSRVGLLKVSLATGLRRGCSYSSGARRWSPSLNSSLPLRWAKRATTSRSRASWPVSLGSAVSSRSRRGGLLSTAAAVAARVLDVPGKRQEQWQERCRDARQRMQGQPQSQNGGGQGGARPPAQSSDPKTGRAVNYTTACAQLNRLSGAILVMVGMKSKPMRFLGRGGQVLRETAQGTLKMTAGSTWTPLLRARRCPPSSRRPRRVRRSRQPLPPLLCRRFLPRSSLSKDREAFVKDAWGLAEGLASGDQLCCSMGGTALYAATSGWSSWRARCGNRPLPKTSARDRWAFGSLSWRGGVWSVSAGGYPGRDSNWHPRGHPRAWAGATA